jgi:hypothetical protein
MTCRTGLGFLMPISSVVALYPFDKFLIERSEYVAPSLAIGAFLLCWTVFTDLSISLVGGCLLTSVAGV